LSKCWCATMDFSAVPWLESQMLVEKQDTLTIFNWLANWIKCGLKSPNKVVCDWHFKERFRWHSVRIVISNHMLKNVLKCWMDTKQIYQIVIYVSMLHMLWKCIVVKGIGKEIKTGLWNNFISDACDFL